ncbi:MAG: hypothetical protein ABH867_05280 [Patescibacteria group bacterium]
MLKASAKSVWSNIVFIALFLETRALFTFELRAPEEIIMSYLLFKGSAK